MKYAGSELKPTTSGAAGLDLVYAGDSPITLTPFELVSLPTGTAVEIPAGHVGLVRGRSGMAFNHGVWVFEGTIDSDYRGDIAVQMISMRGRHTVQPGDRIAQLVIVSCPWLALERVAKLGPSVRGSNGFGSTGR